MNYEEIDFSKSNRFVKFIKLELDFFDSPIVKKLRKYAGGDTYVILYQKIMTHAAKYDGHIKFNGYENNLAEELALILNESAKDLSVTLSFLECNGILEPLSETINFLPNVPPMIYKESESKLRVQSFRSNKKDLLANALQTKQPPLSSTERSRKSRENKRNKGAIGQSVACNEGDVASVEQALQGVALALQGVASVAHENGGKSHKIGEFDFTLTNNFIAVTTECNTQNVASVLQGVACNVACATDATKSPLHIPLHATQNIAENYIYNDVLDCSVTCNASVTECNVADVTCNASLNKNKKESKSINTGGNTPVYIPTREMEDFQQKKKLIENYLIFRLDGDGIENPLAFERSLRIKLEDKSSSEWQNFLEWYSLTENVPENFMLELFQAFLAFGNGDRTTCAEMLKIESVNKRKKISPMMFEIAFQASKKELSKSQRIAQ